MEETRHTLLTGATGLLGQQLLWDLLRAGLPIAVLARPDREDSAVQRLERQLVQREQRTGKRVSRPRVLTGSLTKSNLGLSAHDRTWLKTHCDRVLHCAASVSFRPAASDPQQEPFATNLHGTRRLAELALDSGIREFHHISSAYICGIRQGKVLETEVATGQPFSNDYEKSKCEAEQLLREFSEAFRLTVYRPSIVVPTPGSGTQATSQQTLGLALNALRLLARQRGLPKPSKILKLLGLAGEERKNIVTVDWVARVIVQILRRPELHGETYHLTHSRGIPIKKLVEAFHQVLSPEFGCPPGPPDQSDPVPVFGLEELFTQTLGVYLRDDPQFDRTNLNRGLQVCGEEPSLDLDPLLPGIVATLNAPSSPSRRPVLSEERRPLHRKPSAAPDVTAPAIAIVGMECALPGADGLEEFSRLLFSGRSGIVELAPEQLDRELYYCEKRGTPGRTYTLIGGMVPDRDVSAAGLGLSPEELRQVDPVHQRFGDVAVRAWLRAGLKPHAPDWVRTGVYVGHSGATRKGGPLSLATLIDEGLDFLNDLEDFQRVPAPIRQQILRNVASALRSSRPVRQNGSLPRYQAATVAQLPAQALGLQGPRIVCDAACASALFAMQQAVLALQLGRIDAAIVGGATTNGVDNLILFSQSQACSDTGSFPFDQQASGLVSSEGYAAVIIMREETARQHHLPILGVIEGLGISSDGRGKSLWAPRAEGQQLAMKRAYPSSSPLNIDYLEAHATSTQLGDATELRAISALRKETSAFDARPLLIGSLKSNLGHTLETAGVAGLIKILLAMQHGRIPGTLNFERPNLNFDWSAGTVKVVDRPQSWPARGTVKRAAVSAFGIGGLNAHLTVREARKEFSSPPLVAGTSPPAASVPEPIAIVGRGLVLPGAPGLEQFRSLLASGETRIGSPPENRWRPGIGIGSGPGQVPHAQGGYVRDFTFDVRNCRIPPKQIRQSNPLQFMLLDAVAQAIHECDGGEWSIDRQRTGIIIGTLFDGDFSGQLQLGLRLPEICRELARELQRQGFSGERAGALLQDYQRDILENRPALLDETGSFTASTLASRIAKTFDLMGGAASIDVENASGLAAVRVALDQLRTGHWKFAVCGAAARSMDLNAFEQLHRTGKLLPCGNPAAIPDDCRQILPGEGTAVLLLEPLSQARTAGHRVLGVIHDVDVHPYPQDEATRFTRDDASVIRQIGYVPGVHPLIQLIRQTINQTATSARSPTSSDRGRISSSTRDGMLYHLAFDIAEGPASRPEDPIPVLSGHSGTPVKRDLPIPAGRERSDRLMTPRLPADNAFDPMPPVSAPATTPLFTAVRHEPSSNGSSSLHLVRLQGISSDELEQRIAEAIARPETIFHQPPSGYAAHSVWRLAVLADSPAQLAARLTALQKIRQRGRLQGVFETERALLWTLRPTAGRIAWMFPGQGGHYAGLPDAVRQSAPVRETLTALDAELSQAALPPLTPHLEAPAPQWASGLWESQIWALGLSLAFTAELKSLGLRPDVVLGHSFGEYSALVAAGCLTLSQGIGMVKSRAEAVAMTVLEAGQLISVRGAPREVEAVIRRANLSAPLTHWNAPSQTVIAAGGTQAETLRAQLAAAGLASVPVAVPVAFHTSRLAQAEALLKSQYARERFLPPVCSLLSATSIRYLSEPDDLREALTSQLTQPVLFVPAVERLLADEVAVLIEVGPNQVLSKLSREIAGERALCLSLDLPGRDHVERRLLIQAAVEIVDAAPGTGRTVIHRQTAAFSASGFSSASEPDGGFPATKPTSREVEVIDLHRSGSRQKARRPLSPESPLFSTRAVSLTDAEPHDTVERGFSEAEIRSFLLSIVIDLTGYAAEVIDFNADLEADLGIDSIKKAQMVGELAETYRLSITPSEITPGSLVSLNDLVEMVVRLGSESATSITSSMELSPAVPHPSVRLGQASPDVDLASIEQFLIDLVVDQTGYPPDVVDLDADMEGELGIDSIKQAQLLGEVQQQFELPSVRDAQGTLTGFSTLRSILNYLAEALPQQGSTAFRLSAPELSSSPILEEKGHLKKKSSVPVVDNTVFPGTLPDTDNHRFRVSLTDEEVSSAISEPEPFITMRSTLHIAPAPRRAGLPEIPTFSGPALVLGQNDIATELEERLQREGVGCFRVPAVGSLEELDHWLDRLWTTDLTPHLFLTTSHDAGSLKKIDAEAWSRRRFAALEVPYRLCQRWMQRLIDADRMHEASLVSVVNLGGDFGLSGRRGMSPEGGQAGLVKAMLIEAWMRGHRTTPMKAIDLAPFTTPHQAVAGIWRELARPSFDAEVALHGDERWTIRSMVSPLTEQTGNRTASSRIRRGGTWIVTGGARGITAILARELAKRHGLKLHLMGTAPRPALPEAWKSALQSDRLSLRRTIIGEASRQGENGMEAWRNVEKALEIEETLRQLHAEGISATYHSCNVADLTQLKSTLARIRQQDGPIAGVIHGAGFGQDARFDRKRPDKVDQCLRAKIDGCIHLMEATRDDPLDAFVAFGSISGRFGANGHTDYSLANDTLAKLVDCYRTERPDVSGFTFHWHAWGDVGMATKPETRLALEMVQVEFMPAREGINHFLKELESGGQDSEVLITDRAYLRKFFPEECSVSSRPWKTSPNMVLPLLAPQGIISSGREQTLTVELSPERERFLSQHRIQDSPTLPFVIAIEMLAEAARSVTGSDHVLEAGNVRVMQALKWPTPAPRRLQIQAKSGAAGVTCTLTSDLSRRDGRLVSANKVYFEGIFQTGPEILPLSSRHVNPLENQRVEWRRVSYPAAGGAIYHGPELQSLQAIACCGDQAFGKLFVPSIVQLGGGHRPTTGWSLHAAAMDGCLYACALLAGERSGRASLPVRFERIQFGRLPDAGEPCLVSVQLVQETSQGAELAFQLTGQNGDLLLNVEGYQLHWLS